MAAFYQMLLGKGRLGGVRLFSPRLIAYVTKSHTGELRRRSRWPASRCIAASGRMCAARATGSAASARSARPQTFGHGGAGTSYSWADPTSGVSFTYLTNYVQPDPWHSARLDRIANLVHAAID